MLYHIFGKVQNQVVTSVGCIRNADIPEDSILLQTVEHYPEFHCVKWSVRFSRTLKDRKLLDHPYTKYFRNSQRLRRVLAKEEFDRLSQKENVQFLKHNQKKPDLLQHFLERALAEKGNGRSAFSAGELFGNVRWGDTEIDRANDQFKIDDRWVPWYSRLAQMLEPDLVGFFEIRDSMADGLVWEDGRTWQQFASENFEKLKWTEASDELPDADWEYRG